MESWRNVGTSAARCGSPGPQPPVEWTIKAELLPSTSALRKSSTSLFFSSSVALNQGLFSPHRHSVEKRRRAQMKPESQKLLSHGAHNKTDVILCDSDTHMWGGGGGEVSSWWPLVDSFIFQGQLSGVINAPRAIKPSYLCGIITAYMYTHSLFKTSVEQPLRSREQRPLLFVLACSSLIITQETTRTFFSPRPLFHWQAV